MPNRTQFKHFCALAFVSIFAVTGQGCRSEEVQEVDSTVPFTVENESLAGRPPGAFPADASEDDIVAEMKNHLVGIASRHSTDGVLAYIMLTRSLSAEEFVSIVSRYNLSARSPAAVVVLLGDIQAVSSMYLDATSVSSELTFRTAVVSKFAPNHPGFPDAPDVSIENIRIWATPKDLLRLWNDRPDLIRAIGAGGVEGKQARFWYPVRPGEPLR